jgi:hypothetical protein
MGDTTVTAPTDSRGPGALVVIVAASMVLGGCAAGSSDPSTDGGDLRDEYVGTWTRSADDGLSSLDSFFGKSFSLRFSVGSIDKPKPDYVFLRR